MKQIYLLMTNTCKGDNLFFYLFVFIVKVKTEKIMAHK